MLADLSLLRKVLVPADRRRLWGVGALLLLAGVFESIAVASVLPFLDAVASPSAVEKRAYLAWAYRAFEFRSETSFVVAVGGATFALLLVGNAIGALCQSRIFRFSWSVYRCLSTRILRTYLYAPYEFHLSKNASELLRAAVWDTSDVVIGCLMPGLQVVSRLLVVLLIVAVLVAIEPLAALVSVAVLGGSYALVLAVTRRHAARAGRAREQAGKNCYQVASESLAAFREIRIYGAEEAFFARYDANVGVFSRAQARHQWMSLFPKYVVELLAFGGVVLLATFLLTSGRPAGSTVAFLGLFTFAGYRLVPALQICFNSITSIRFFAPALRRVADDLLSSRAEPRPASAVPPAELPPPRSEIRLDAVTFAYPGREDAVFRDLNLVVPVGSSVAIVGPTGSGKSTLLDLLFGFLRPRSGALCVDGRPLDDASAAVWRRHVAYVCQTPVLIDATMRENIAFGEDPAAIDDARVREAADVACIRDFIEKELPQGYDTVVGDRGVRLSGGQRQRLAIARALYSRRPVIVLDEATSALDADTETAVIGRLHREQTGRTLVFVTHRPSVAEGVQHVWDIRHLSRTDAPRPASDARGPGGAAAQV